MGRNLKGKEHFTEEVLTGFSPEQYIKKGKNIRVPCFSSKRDEAT